MPLPEVIGATIETACVALHADLIAPGAGVLGTAIATYLFKRRDIAKTILRSELERAGATERDFHDVDQFAAAALRYHRAARDQAADENLKLLAQAMVGLARRQEIWASDFLRYSEILAPLSRDELIVIGLVMQRDEANAGAAIWQQCVDAAVPTIFPDQDTLDAIGARAVRSGLIMPLNVYDASAFQLSPLGRDLRSVVKIDQVLNG